MPFGTYTKPIRTGDFAVLAERAGVIASRYGSATAAPKPLKNVLRGSALCRIISVQPPSLSQYPPSVKLHLCAPERAGWPRSPVPEPETDIRRLRAYDK